MVPDVLALMESYLWAGQRTRIRKLHQAVRYNRAGGDFAETKRKYLKRGADF